MIDTTDGVQFDPGFIQHISAFEPNIQYVYNTLNSFKNFNQKKLQFRMFYPKIQSLLKNYIGFYSGCILWAVYIKTLDNKQILGNLCFGGEYSENDTLEEVHFIENYLEQLEKDVKYYTGQNYTPALEISNILSAYKEFLIINKGFVETQTTNDIKLPQNFKTPDNMEEIIYAIEKAVNDGKLSELTPLAEKVI